MPWAILRKRMGGEYLAWVELDGGAGFVGVANWLE